MGTREEKKQAALNELYEGYFVKAIYTKGTGGMFFTVRQNERGEQTHFVLEESIFDELKNEETILLKSAEQGWTRTTEIWVYWEENPNGEFII